VRPSLTKKTNKRAGSMAQVIKHLSNIQKVLGRIPTTYTLPKKGLSSQIQFRYIHGKKII
jgi:hypothetical protein